MRGSTVHGVGKYGVRITCVGSDDYLPTLPYLRLCFSLFYFFLGRDRVGQVGMWGMSELEYSIEWHGMSGMGKLVGPQARVHSYALARFLFLCFRWARRRRVRRRMSGCLCFHISGRPRMQGLVELGRLTCIYLRPWGGRCFVSVLVH